MGNHSTILAHSTTLYQQEAMQVANLLCIVYISRSFERLRVKVRWVPVPATEPEDQFLDKFSVAECLSARTKPASSDDERVKRGRCSSCGLLEGPLLDAAAKPVSTWPSTMLREVISSAFRASSGCIIRVSGSGCIVSCSRLGLWEGLLRHSCSTWLPFKLRENISSAVRCFA